MKQTIPFIFGVIVIAIPAFCSQTSDMQSVKDIRCELFQKKERSRKRWAQKRARVASHPKVDSREKKARKPHTDRFTQEEIHELRTCVVPLLPGQATSEQERRLMRNQTMTNQDGQHLNSVAADCPAPLEALRREQRVSQNPERQLQDFQDLLIRLTLKIRALTINGFKHESHCLELRLDRKAQKEKVRHLERALARSQDRLYHIEHKEQYQKQHAKRFEPVLQAFSKRQHKEKFIKVLDDIKDRREWIVPNATPTSPVPANDSEQTNGQSLFKWLSSFL